MQTNVRKIIKKKHEKIKRILILAENLNTILENHSMCAKLLYFRQPRLRSASQKYGSLYKEYILLVTSDMVND